MESAETFTEFCREWLTDVESGSPSTTELGRYFARALQNDQIGYLQWEQLGKTEDASCIPWSAGRMLTHAC